MISDPRASILLHSKPLQPGYFSRMKKRSNIQGFIIPMIQITPGRSERNLFFIYKQFIPVICRDMNNQGIWFDPQVKSFPKQVYAVTIGGPPGNRNPGCLPGLKQYVVICLLGVLQRGENYQTDRISKAIVSCFLFKAPTILTGDK